MSLHNILHVAIYDIATFAALKDRKLKPTIKSDSDHHQ